MLISLKRDIRPPTAPVLGTPTTLSSSSISIPLATAASDANGIASYTLEYSTSLGGTYVEATATAVFPQTVTGLNASTQYFFRSKAVDNFGNDGPYSGIVTATTQVTNPGQGLAWPLHAPGYVSLIPEVGGYGMNTVAGSGRHLGTPATTVILVNSLSTGNTGGAVSGYGANVFAGTWEYAWRHNASPKVIVPIVSGWVTIQEDITNQTGTAPRPGYVSYYGQFAPNPGLYLRGCNVTVNGASNVAVWHLRSYMGDDVTGVAAGARDCISSGYGGGVTQSIVLINCEFLWSVDELVDLFRNHNQVSFLGCAFIEPLHISTVIHPEDGAGVDHGFGPIIGGSTGTDQSSAVSLFRNLWAHTTGRNPLISAQTFVHANNLHYNHGRPTGGAGNAVQIIATGATASNHANILGNGFVRGPNNNTSLVAVSVTGTYPTGSAGYLFGNAQFGWTALASQNNFLTASPSGYAAAAVQATAYPSSWGTGIGGVLQWAANPLAPTLTEWHNFVTLMDASVGAQPIWRTSGRVKVVFDQIRDRLNGVTQTDQFIDTVTEAGGWFSVASTTIDPLNPGSQWHGPLPTGSDRDTPYTSGTFSDGKSRIGYTRLEEWAYEQHLFVTTEQAVSSSADYDFIDNPVGYTDHWVAPGSTSGTGAFATPYTITQMLQFPIAGGRHRFILKPGTYSITGAAGDSKMPFLDPQSSGTVANPVLVKAQFAATNASTTPAQLSIIRRTGGQGSILGTQGRNYWRWDGFKIAGTHGGNGFENAHIVLRSAIGWWFTRFHIDDEFASYVGLEHEPTGSTNGGGIFMQLISSCVLRDFIIENLGNPIGANLRVWQPVEFYDTTDTEVSYFTIRNIWGIGVHMKGAPAVQFQRIRIHHGLVDNCRDTGIHPYDVEAGTTPANHNYWWNIVVKNSGGHGVQFNVIGGPHRGTHLQNITVVNSTNSSVMFRPETYSSDISIRNSVFDNSSKHIEFLDALYPQGGNNSIVWDYNRYNRFTNIDESGSGSDSLLVNWRSRSGQDANSDTATAAYVNAAGGDYTTATSVTADAPDTHNLYGGGTVKRGAFELLGHRTNV
jgi:hypothetical protein